MHPDTPTVTRTIQIGGAISISQEDYKEHKGKEVRLLHVCNIIVNTTAIVTSVENKKIPKIQWVSGGVKTKILMPDGTWIEGLAEKEVQTFKEGDVIQFERFGFVRCDGEKNGVYEFWFAHK